MKNMKLLLAISAIFLVIGFAELATSLFTNWSDFWSISFFLTCMMVGLFFVLIYIRNYLKMRR